MWHRRHTARLRLGSALCVMTSAIGALVGCGRVGFDERAGYGGLADAGLRGGSSLDADSGSGLPQNARLVFLTTTSYPGSLGGMDSYSLLDANCTTLANGAGHAGNYAIVLSIGATAASTHVTLASGRPIVLVSGTQVATDATFFTATHTAAISEDVAGAAAAVNATWTDSSPAGASLGDDCTGWTSALSSALGVVGSPSAADMTWANAGTAKCNRVANLMCIEQ